MNWSGFSKAWMASTVAAIVAMAWAFYATHNYCLLWIYAIAIFLFSVINGGLYFYSFLRLSKNKNAPLLEVMLFSFLGKLLLAIAILVGASRLCEGGALTLDYTWQSDFTIHFIIVYLLYLVQEVYSLMWLSDYN